MRLVRMLVPMAGPELVLQVGDEHLAGDAEAGRLVAAGFAVVVDEGQPIEAAVAKPKAERATVKRKPRKRRPKRAK